MQPTFTRTRAAISCIALCAASMPAISQNDAQQPSWSIVLHGISAHSGRMAGGQRYNEAHAGLSLRYQASRSLAIQGGRFKNSLGVQASYLLADYTPLHIGPVSAGAFAGRVTGYPLTKYAAGAVIRANGIAHPRLGAALRLTPKWQTSPSAAALEISWSF